MMRRIQRFIGEFLLDFGCFGRFLLHLVPQSENVTDLKAYGFSSTELITPDAHEGLRMLEKRARRLIGAHCAEQHQDWAHGKRYLTMEDYLGWKAQLGTATSTPIPLYRKPLNFEA